MLFAQEVPSIDVGAALLGVGLFITLILTGVKVVSFIKSITNHDLNSVVTQIAAWVTLIALVFLAAGSDFGPTAPISDALNLANVNWQSKVLVGILLGSAASAWYDRTKAKDNTQSAAEKALLPSYNDRPPAA